MDAAEAKAEGINTMEVFQSNVNVNLIAIYQTKSFWCDDILKDLDAKRPGLSDAVRLFFRVYKVGSLVIF